MRTLSAAYYGVRTYIVSNLPAQCGLAPTASLAFTVGTASARTRPAANRRRTGALAHWRIGLTHPSVPFRTHYQQARRQEDAAIGRCAPSPPISSLPLSLSAQTAELHDDLPAYLSPGTPRRAFDARNCIIPFPTALHCNQSLVALSTVEPSHPVLRPLLELHQLTTLLHGRLAAHCRPLLAAAPRNTFETRARATQAASTLAMSPLSSWPHRGSASATASTLPYCTISKSRSRSRSESRARSESRLSRLPLAVSTPAALLAIAAVLLPMADAHDHAVENIPDGSATSPDPIVRLVLLCSLPLLPTSAPLSPKPVANSALPCSRTRHYGPTSSSTCSPLACSFRSAWFSA